MGKNKESPVRMLLRHAAPYKNNYITAGILSVISVCCGMVPFFAVAAMLRSMMEGHGDGLAFYLGCCGIAAGAYICKGILAGISTSVSHKATFLTMKDMRSKLTDKLGRMPMGDIIDRPSGYFKDVIVDRVESIEVPFAHFIPEMTANVLAPALMLIYIFILDRRLALISLITLPVGMLIMRGVMKSYGKKYEESVRIGNKMTNSIVEYMGGIEVIKAFSSSAKSYKKYTEAVEENASFFYNWMKSAQWAMSAYTAITPSVLLTVLPLGAVFFATGSITAPVFVTVIILSIGLIEPIIHATNFTDDISRVGTVLGQIDGIINGRELERPKVSKEKSDGSGGDIEFSDVTFYYDDEKKKAALRDCSLSVPSGKVTALVGPSGSGKSTIAKLIAGFWDTDCGTISIGGANVKEIPMDAHIEKISYVSQDNYLFNDTVLENIRIGKSDASDEEVIQAAKAAGCDEFIRKLEKGYDTVTGSGGGHLSGGERQRIAIARAMLKDAPIVILDEATAYIDPENEAIIQRAVAKLVKGKTLLIIAHRLSTITDADKIIVMKDGRVSDSGTHEELLGSSSVYQSLWAAHTGQKGGEA